MTLSPPSSAFQLNGLPSLFTQLTLSPLLPKRITASEGGPPNEGLPAVMTLGTGDHISVRAGSPSLCWGAQ